MDASWRFISALLVLSSGSWKVANLAVTRVKADFVGALVGLLCSLIVPASMWMIAVALVGTLLLCYVFSLDAGIRSSLVATINVILYQGQHLWGTSQERVVGVMAGCL